jgi:UDP:flavonoid glycosyltransferase YjiC (YdhE family)
MAAAAHIRIIHPEMMVFNRLALSVVVLAAVAWLPGAHDADELSSLFAHLCTPSVKTADAARPNGRTETISYEAFANLPGKRVTIVQVTYAPGGYTPSHRHAGSLIAYVTAGTIRSQLAGGQVETFKECDCFF